MTERIGRARLILRLIAWAPAPFLRRLFAEILLCSIALHPLYAFAISEQKNPVCGSLLVQVNSIPDQQGHLAYALFNHSDGFPSQRHLAYRRGFVSIPSELRLKLTFNDLPCGKYALALYHDRNENQKLDKNLVGIPKESIGFTNNPKVRLGPPSFQDAEFSLTPQELRLEVEMIH